MKILINDHRKIFSVQEEFGKLFANLRIEFFGKPSNEGKSASTKPVKSAKTVGDCRIVHNKGELTVSPHMTIADLKQTLAGTYGLSVAVLRKSGDEWVDALDNNTMEEQNQTTLT